MSDADCYEKPTLEIDAGVTRRIGRRAILARTAVVADPAKPGTAIITAPKQTTLTRTVRDTLEHVYSHLVTTTVFGKRLKLAYSQ